MPSTRNCATSLPSASPYLAVGRANLVVPGLGLDDPGHHSGWRSMSQDELLIRSTGALMNASWRTSDTLELSRTRRLVAGNPHLYSEA